MAHPTRPLAQAGAAKPHRYVNKDHTDIRKTFEKFRRLQAMQQLKTQEGETK